MKCLYGLLSCRSESYSSREAGVERLSVGVRNERQGRQRILPKDDRIIRHAYSSVTIHRWNEAEIDSAVLFDVRCKCNSNKSSGITALAAIIVLILVQALPRALTQTQLPAPQQLDQLWVPIALYPDSLLAQITTAATNPQEFLDVDNWLASYPRLSDAAQQQGSGH